MKTDTILTFAVTIATAVADLPLPSLTSSPPPPPQWTIPCSMGGSCPSPFTCTPTMPSPSSGPWGGLCVSFPTPTPSSSSPDPPQWTVACTGGAGGDSCPPPLVCKQTLKAPPGATVFGGVCYTVEPTPTPSSSPPPPQWTVPCTMGGYCPPPLTCTPTMPAPTGGPWGGLCFSAPTPPPSSSSPPPPQWTVPCTMGGYCPSQMTCTPTMVPPTSGPWGGLCITTLVPSSLAPCTMSRPSPACPTGSTCTPTMVCTSGRPCGGLCLSTPTPPSSSAPLSSTPLKRCRGGRFKEDCEEGQICTEIRGSKDKKFCVDTCGGFVGKQCPGGRRCVDLPGDGCDPKRGGADCRGICV
ncbi:hypothetical protein P152DRAFT_101825 [Eremomyces bilateralis CBS 781.70]|uniref:IGFBP N-terminal domain-containing protein n=1 Tax=Eremomyces bilateralis CBS 781.70 TaxID=1392243 RepID=A0A6G1FWY5_9PEZI|nr:uncharacterized protein P152DRAFT_101825 [Eremomyces bilateralis CBS 781.70]KAF1810190.1 hypothetical protein P152DRAFT_101825 [Eremomyces bilateralis CBS 781.70]